MSNTFLGGSMKRLVLMVALLLSGGSVMASDAPAVTGGADEVAFAEGAPSREEFEALGAPQNFNVGKHWKNAPIVKIQGENGGKDSSYWARVFIKRGRGGESSELFAAVRTSSDEWKFYKNTPDGADESWGYPLQVPIKSQVTINTLRPWLAPPGTVEPKASVSTPAATAQPADGGDTPGPVDAPQPTPNTVVDGKAGSPVNPPQPPKSPALTDEQKREAAIAKLEQAYENAYDLHGGKAMLCYGDPYLVTKDDKGEFFFQEIKDDKLEARKKPVVTEFGGVSTFNVAPKQTRDALAERVPAPVSVSAPPANPNENLVIPIEIPDDAPKKPSLMWRIGRWAALGFSLGLGINTVRQIAQANKDRARAAKLLRSAAHNPELVRKLKRSGARRLWMSGLTGFGSLAALTVGIWMFLNSSFTTE